MGESSTSKWARAAWPVIQAVLGALPGTATREDKKRALRLAYPFGPRKHHPYRIWCREVAEAIGPKSSRTEIIKMQFRLSLPLKMEPAGVEPFLRAIADLPYEPGPRAILADWLEERGDCLRSQLIREPAPIVNRKLRDMYRAITGVTANQTVAELLMDLQIGRPPLIVDPDCVRAIEAATNAAVLKLFGQEWKTQEPVEAVGATLPDDGGHTGDEGDDVGGPPF